MNWMALDCILEYGIISDPILFKFDVQFATQYILLFSICVWKDMAA